MFGIANQLLASTALAVGTTIILREASKPTYALVTLAPLCFVGTTTLTAGVTAIKVMYLPLMANPETYTRGVVNTVVTGTLLFGVVSILIGSAARWVSLWRRRATAEPAPA
jgi:carbon starvation protein